VTQGPTSTAWEELFVVDRPRSIDELFGADPGRAERFTFGFGDLVVDLSKNLIDDRVMETLSRVASEAGVEEAIRRLLDGEIVNATEGRAAAHAALRRPSNVPSMVGDADVSASVDEVLSRMRRFVTDVHAGRRVGATGSTRPRRSSSCRPRPSRPSRP